MEDLRGKIIAFIRSHGPSLPVQISSHISSNSIFAGAMLSELLARKMLKLSNSRIGGSALYYIPGQEGMIGQKVYNYLKEVHKKMYDMLRQNKVLYDPALEPWQRVAIREIPDFAYPINWEDGIYWRWFAVSEQDAIQSIKNSIQKEEPVQEQVVEEFLTEPVVEVKPVVEEQQIQQIIQEIKPIKIQQEIIKEIKKPVEQKIVEKHKEINKEDDGFTLIDSFFNKNDIEVLNAEMLRKNLDYEFVVSVPSNVGKVKFFVKFRNKKKLNDSDLSLAQNNAYLKRLPLLFVYSGELTNKAREYAEKNYITLCEI